MPSFALTPRRRRFGSPGPFARQRWAWALAWWLGSATVAHAQSASDKAAAEALFDQGLELLKAGSYEEACQRLESSQRIDPGIGTLLYLAECYEKMGKTASAWATFREAASAADAAGQTERAQIGSNRAKRLESHLLRLFMNPDPQLKSIENLEILRDDKPVSPALWGTAIPVDPGEHVIEVRAPGYESFRTSVVCEGEGQTQTLDLPMLRRLPESAQGAAPQESAQSSELAVDSRGSDGSIQRTGGLVLAGLGVVGVGIGSYFGLRAISKNGQAQDFCDGNRCTDSQGLTLSDEALSSARVSNIAFIAGGAALAGGLVLFFTAPRQQEVTRLEMVPTLGGAQLQLGRSF